MCVVLLLAAGASVGVSASQAHLIELNDPNQAKLGSVLSKAVRGLQSALTRGFRFNSSPEVDRFLDHCDLVRDELARSKDDAYGGLAGQLRRLLADDELASACQASRGQLDQFRPLDTDFKPNECDYLAASKFQLLVDMKRQLAASRSLELVYGHLFKVTVDGLGSRLLAEAAHDFEILVGEQEQKTSWFDLETRYKRACSLAELRPICQLVRRTGNEDVTALGADLADFGELLRACDKQTIGVYEQKSGVKLASLAKGCTELDKRQAFKPIRQLEAYRDAQFISGQQVAERLAASSELNLYYELYQLCKLVQPGACEGSWLPEVSLA